MKLQTERLENNTARLIVELETADLDRVKRSAAIHLSSKYKIPGFRKGKAPYNIIAKFVGEAAIVEQAVEMLADEIYPKALLESGLRPYANGSLDDVTLEPVPVYTFTLPLQAEIKLGDYKNVRAEYVAPAVDDVAVERALDAVRQQKAVTTHVEGQIESGHRITVDLETHFVDGEERSTEAETEDDEAHNETDDDARNNDTSLHYKGDEYIRRQNAAVNLNPDNEPFLPGFIDEIVGKHEGDVVEFDLIAPTDSTDFAEIAGRTIHFEVAIKKVENVELPELSDEFAQMLTADEDSVLDLAQLRARLRENLEQEAASEYNNQYADEVLELITDQTTLSFPELMVDNRVTEMIEDFKRRLRQQNISFDMYKTITGTDDDTLKKQYRADAEKFVRRSLVLGEIMVSEHITLERAEINSEIDNLVGQFGGDEKKVRTLLNAKDQRENIANRLLFNKLMEQVTRIGKGELATPDEGTASIPAGTEND